jgi:predicted nucleotidyltransferase
VERELATLTQAGLIVRKKTGNQVFYSASREHPIYAELSGLVAKTTGMFGLLKEALAPLSDQIQFAFVYGSVARGEETAASDIDLMVIGSLRFDDLLERLAILEQILGRPINPSIYSAKEVKAKLKANHHFLRAIQRGKSIFMIGDEHELRQIH